MIRVALSRERAYTAWSRARLVCYEVKPGVVLEGRIIFPMIPEWLFLFGQRGGCSFGPMRAEKLFVFAEE